MHRDAARSHRFPCKTERTLMRCKAAPNPTINACTPPPNTMALSGMQRPRPRLGRCQHTINTGYRYPMCKPLVDLHLMLRRCSRVHSRRCGRHALRPHHHYIIYHRGRRQHSSPKACVHGAQQWLPRCTSAKSSHQWPPLPQLPSPHRRRSPSTRPCSSKALQCSSNKPVSANFSSGQTIRQRPWSSRLYITTILSQYMLMITPILAAN